MSLSPFPTNAKLTFHLPTGQTVTDPATGNVISVLGDLDIECYLKPDGVQSNRSIDASPGVQTPSEAMSGRMTNPIYVPASIPVLAEADAIVGGQVGKFLMRIPTQDVWGIRDVLGDKIYGTFTALKETTPVPVVDSGLISAIALESNRLVAVVDGLLVYADQSILSHAYAIVGMTKAPTNPGQAVVLLSEGVINSSGWNWTPGEPLFVGSNGLITQDADSITTGFLASAGRVISPQQIYLDIDEEPIFL
ncbi:MAG: hypothetical protein KME13_21625 [Myxacorys californica WJT36-NPBG1]|jgi:hypothetical protein|nr:hypothetical protein [Myxacorys californica WJT36-NPBG1]